MVSLFKIANIRAGHPFRSKLIQHEGAGTRVIQMKDVNLWDGINWNSVVESPPFAKGAPDWVQEEDILFISRGLSINAIHVENMPYKQVLAAPHFYLITADKNKIEPSFLAWQINQKPCQDYLRKNSEGSTTKSIRRSLVDNMPIVIPPHKEQLQIVELYNCIRKERRLALQLIKNGERLMTGLAVNTLNNVYKGKV